MYNFQAKYITDQAKCITDCYNGLTKNKVYTILQAETNDKQVFPRHQERYILKNDFNQLVSVPKFCFE